MIDDSQDYTTGPAPLDPETLSFEQVIEGGVRSALLECRTAIPCAVTHVQADGSVHAQPLIKTRFLGQDASNLPELLSIPVSFPQGGDWRIQPPIAVGDTGYALVMDRDIDSWLAGDGSPQLPTSDRAHFLSDAIFVPMLVVASARKLDAGTDLVIENGALQLRLEKSGKLRINNSGQELVTVLDGLLATTLNLVAALEQLQVLTMTGPAPVMATSVAALEQVRAQLTTLRQNADTFLG